MMTYRSHRQLPLTVGVQSDSARIMNCQQTTPFESGARAAHSFDWIDVKNNRYDIKIRAASKMAMH